MWDMCGWSGLLVMCGHTLSSHHLCRIYLAVLDLITEMRQSVPVGDRSATTFADSFAHLLAAEARYFIPLVRRTICARLCGNARRHAHYVRAPVRYMYRRTTYQVRVNERDPLVCLFWRQYLALMLPLFLFGSWNFFMMRTTSLGQVMRPTTASARHIQPLTCLTADLYIHTHAHAHAHAHVCAHTHARRTASSAAAQPPVSAGKASRSTPQMEASRYVGPGRGYML